MLDIDIGIFPNKVCSVEGVLLFYQFTLAAMVQREEMICLRLFQHTELEHTPSNLYQQAMKGFLSLLARGIAWGVLYGCVVICLESGIRHNSIHYLHFHIGYQVWHTAVKKVKPKMLTQRASTPEQNRKNSQPYRSMFHFFRLFQKSHPKLPERVFLTQQTSKLQLRGSHFDDVFLGRSGSICWSSMKLIFSRQAWEFSRSATGCAISAAIRLGKCRKHHPVGGCW